MLGEERELMARIDLATSDSDITLRRVALRLVTLLDV